MTSKDCGKHDNCHKKKFYRRVFGFVLSFVLLVLAIVFLIWLILRPTKPRFSLVDTSVSRFNLSAAGYPNYLSSTLQVTLTSRNPNDRIGVYYDRLDVYATYKSQPVTIPVALLPSYQGHNDVTTWSPVLGGDGVPIAPYLCVSIAQDQAAGIILLHVKVDGRVRWKVGSWISGTYHIHVNCPAFLSYDGGSNGMSPVMRFQQITSCTVDV